VSRDLWRAAFRAGPGCPSIEELAANPDRAREHARRCPRCAAELTLLEAWQEEPPRNDRDVGWIVARLRGHARAPRAGALLVAAGVVLALFAGLLYRPRPEAPSVSARMGAETVLRSNSIDATEPEGDLDRPPAELRWRALAGADRYVAVLMEVDRAPLWQAETREAAVALPRSVQERCLPGKTLLWQVRALDAGGLPLAASEITRFRVKPE
jgi:hypothetical protein